MLGPRNLRRTIHTKRVCPLSVIVHVALLTSHLTDLIFHMALLVWFDKWNAPKIGLCSHHVGVEIISNSSGSHHELRKLDTRINLITQATKLVMPIPAI